MPNLNSKEVDQGILRAFQAAQEVKFKETDRVYVDEVAMHAMRHLIGKGYNAELRAYLDPRIEEIETTPAASVHRYRLKSLKIWQGRLQG